MIEINSKLCAFFVGMYFASAENDKIVVHWNNLTDSMAR